MGNVLVGLIVAAALFYLIKRVINVFKGDCFCSCECDGCIPGPHKDCGCADEDSDTDKLKEL